MMRRLMIFLTVLALLWCGWWAVASAVAGRSVHAWLDARRAAGWQVDATVEKSGFPLALRHRLRDLALRDPATRTGFAADDVTLSAAAYWPGNLTLELPDTPIHLSVMGEDLSLRAQNAWADLDLSPGIALELARAEAKAGKWMLTSDGQTLADGKGIKVIVLEEGTEPGRYAFEIGAQGVTPGGPVRAALNLPVDWPQSFDSVIARMTVVFDRPLDRHMRQGALPQPRHVTLSALDLAWGALRLTGSGDVAIAADGTPTGDVMLQVDNWQDTLDIATQSGLLPAPLRSQAQMMLGALANLGGGGEDLKVSLVFSNGEMALGPINLGPAPKLGFE